jgi:hypothetical protein
VLGRTLVVVVALAGAGGATAVADVPTAGESGKKAKRCPASQVRTKVTIAKRKGHRRHRASVCVPRSAKRPASASAALRQSRAIGLKHAPRRVARLLRKPAARRVRAAGAATDRALLAGLHPAARASTVTHDSDTQILRGPPGTRTVQHREGTNWDDEEPNPGTELEVTIDTTSTRIGGLSSSKATRAKMTRTMARCPDAGGVGRGVLKYLQSEKQIVDKPGGGRAVHEVRGEFDAKVLVHFNDEAKVTSVDVAGTWKWSSGSSLSLYAAGGGVSATAGPDGRVSSFDISVSNATSPGAAVVGTLLGVLTAEVPREFVTELVSGAARRAGGGRCARLVPDPATVHVKPNETVAITTGLVDFDGAPLSGTVKAKAAKSTVAPAEAQADPVARFTYSALSAVPADRTDTVSLKHVSKRGRASEKSVTVIYDDPPTPPLPNAYGGTFSGRWDTASVGEEHWTYTGTVEVAYAGDDAAPPPGGPPDRYRRFHVTSGTAHVIVHALFAGGDCGFEGNGDITLDPGDQSGSLSVQATDKPAYLIGLSSRAKTIRVTKTGSDSSCSAGDTMNYPVPGIWAQTRSAHTSASSTLADSEDDSTPESPFDYDTVSHWNLAPR